MSQTSHQHLADARRTLTRRRSGLLVGFLTIALVAAACGKKDELKGEVVKEGLGCTSSEVDRRADAPEVDAGTKVGKKTATKDLIKGKGRTAGAECFLSLDIVSATAKDGKVFASTWESGHPITVQSAQTGLVTGLDTGIKGMKVGTRRQVTVPAAEGYGKDGNPAQGVGKDADLVFVVDLISVTATPVYCSEVTDIPTEVDGKKIEGKPTADQIEMPVKVPEDEVTVRDIEKGTEGKAIGDSAFVEVRYLGVSCQTGRQFDSSWDRGKETFKVALGSASDPTGEYGSVITGWSVGLKGAKAGTLRQLDIPYQFAYGSTARDADIGPYATLVFVIEVVKVSTKAPTPTTTTTAAAETTTTAAGDATTTTTAAGDATTTTEADATTTTEAKTTTTKGD